MKKFISLVLVMVLILSFMTFSYAENAFAGYTAITTPEELYFVRDNLAGNYYLACDIDLTEALAEGGILEGDGDGWDSIGSRTNPFTGIFDGNGHTVSGLNSALFMVNNGIVRNLTVNGEITRGLEFNFSGRPYGYYAAVACQNMGTISNCVNNAFVKVNEAKTSIIVYCGGICGTTEGANAIVQMSVNHGNIDVRNVGNSSCSYVGGIAGVTKNRIEKVANTGTISAYSGNIATSGYIGGIVGQIATNVFLFSTYNVGDIYADYPGTLLLGGVCGQVVSNSIYYAYNRGHVYKSSGENQNLASGICGNLDSVKQAYFCYYLNTSAESATRSISDSSINDTVRAYSETLMQDYRAYAGFDFEDIWTIGCEDYPYPVLQFENRKFVSDINPYTINSISLYDLNGSALNTIPEHKFMAKVSITNKNASTDAFVVLATYADGKFCDAYYVNIEEMTPKSTVSVSFPVDPEMIITELKAFTVESIGSFEPISSVVEWTEE